MSAEITLPDASGSNQNSSTPQNPPPAASTDYRYLYPQQYGYYRNYLGYYPEQQYQQYYGGQYQQYYANQAAQGAAQGSPAGQPGQTPANSAQPGPQNQASLGASGSSAASAGTSATNASSGPSSSSTAAAQAAAAAAAASGASAGPTNAAPYYKAPSSVAYDYLRYGYAQGYPVYQSANAAATIPVSLTSTLTVGQVQPLGVRPRVTTTMWEDEKTVCYQVEANGVSVVRRADNNMINGTKLLNVAHMTRGRRDGILKSEKVRHVVKIGLMHLKGVWIPFDRALAMAQKEKIVDDLYPLFVRDIKRVIEQGSVQSASPAQPAAAAAAAAAASQSQAASANQVQQPAQSQQQLPQGQDENQWAGNYPQEYQLHQQFYQYPYNGYNGYYGAYYGQQGQAAGQAVGQGAAQGAAQPQGTQGSTAAQAPGQAQAQAQAQVQSGRGGYAYYQGETYEAKKEE